MITVEDLYPDDTGNPLAHEAVVLGQHLIDSHGFTLSTLGDQFPADSGSPEADLLVLEEIHRRETAICCE